MAAQHRRSQLSLLHVLSVYAEGGGEREREREKAFRSSAVFIPTVRERETSSLSEGLNRCGKQDDGSCSGRGRLWGHWRWGRKHIQSCWRPRHGVCEWGLTWRGALSGLLGCRVLERLVSLTRVLVQSKQRRQLGPATATRRVRAERLANQLQPGDAGLGQTGTDWCRPAARERVSCLLPSLWSNPTPGCFTRPLSRTCRTDNMLITHNVWRHTHTHAKSLRKKTQRQQRILSALCLLAGVS